VVFVKTGFVDEMENCLSGSARGVDESARRVDNPLAVGRVDESLELVGAPA